MDREDGESDTIQGWTRKELISALKRAGWTREDAGPAVLWVSPQGTRFYLDQGRASLGGVAWRYFARRRELPPPDYPTF